jgi:tRNA G18 (ribose-2'-O)-methylase SpoU
VGAPREREPGGDAGSPPPPVRIDDPSDPRLDGYRRLTDARYRDRYERHHGVLVAEGELAVRRLLGSPHPARSVLIATRRMPALAALAADARAAGATTYLADPAVMAEVTGYDVHRGVLGLGGRLPAPDPAALLAAPGVVLGLEGINDGENMGALLRSAAALGACGVVLDPTCCDPWSRRSVRVSVGNALHVPVARSSVWPLPAGGAGVVALTPAAGAVPIAEVAARIARRPPRTVLLLAGAEGPGLGAASLAAAGCRVRIPMAGGVDSLNVGAAVAVALQRITEAMGGS